MSITTQHQDVMASWLCKRIGLVPTPNMQCIGRVNAEGDLIGVVGFDGYNGASVMMHCAGEGNWVSRRLLWAAFDYPFRLMQCNVVLGLVPSGNHAALKLNRHLGFQLAAVLHGAHPDGAMLVLTMRREDCRYLPMLGGVNSPAQEHALLQ